MVNAEGFSFNKCTLVVAIIDPQWGTLSPLCITNAHDEAHDKAYDKAYNGAHANSQPRSTLSLISLAKGLQAYPIVEELVLTAS